MFALCADKSCPKKDSCYRYVANPMHEMKSGKHVRIVSSLKHKDEEVCSKYRITVLEKHS